MSFRIEEKLSIDNNKIIDFKSFLANKTAKQIYLRRIILSLYFEYLNYELEMKISSVEGRFKTRKIIDKSKFNYIKTKGILDSQYGLCKPCLYVIYDREYFKIDDVRISIDNNISYKLYPENIYEKDESSIVEIKTSIKKNLDKLTEDFPFQKNRFSKYCNAVEKIIFEKNKYKLI